MSSGSVDFGSVSYSVVTLARYVPRSSQAREHIRGKERTKLRGSNLGKGLLVGRGILYLEHAVYEEWEYCLYWFHGMSGVTIGVWSHSFVRREDMNSYEQEQYTGRSYSLWNG